MCASRSSHTGVGESESRGAPFVFICCKPLRRASPAAQPLRALWARLATPAAPAHRYPSARPCEPDLARSEPSLHTPSRLCTNLAAHDRPNLLPRPALARAPAGQIKSPAFIHTTPLDVYTIRIPCDDTFVLDRFVWQVSARHELASPSVLSTEEELDLRRQSRTRSRTWHRVRSSLSCTFCFPSLVCLAAVLLHKLRWCVCSLSAHAFMRGLVDSARARDRACSGRRHHLYRCIGHARFC